MLEDIIKNSNNDLKEVFKKIEEREEYNSEKVLNAFIENSICILQKDGINYIYDDKLGIWINKQYKPSYKIVNL